MTDWVAPANKTPTPQNTHDAHPAFYHSWTCESAGSRLDRSHLWSWFTSSQVFRHDFVSFLCFFKVNPSRECISCSPGPCKAHGICIRPCLSSLRCVMSCCALTSDHRKNSLFADHCLLICCVRRSIGGHLMWLWLYHPVPLPNVHMDNWWSDFSLSYRKSLWFLQKAHIVEQMVALIGWVIQDIDLYLGAHEQMERQNGVCAHAHMCVCSFGVSERVGGLLRCIAEKWKC